MVGKALLIATVAGASFLQAPARLQADPPIVCQACAAWNQPQAPFRVFGNTYYVGVAGLSAVLVTSPDGHVLLDGALPQSAPLIDANIRALGFETRDVRIIVNSHAHFDHAGGIAALQRATGAQVTASASGARALEAGEPVADDPNRSSGPFPRVPRVRVVADGEVVRAGALSVTAHYTPGHTPGSTAWTWRSCEGARCLDVVYADSLNPVSAPGFRFTGNANTPSRIALFRTSIAKVAALPCDILLSVHPDFANLSTKLARRTAQPDTNPFIDVRGCRAYAAAALRALDRRIASER